MTNEKIRTKAKEKNIKLWMIAEKMGICDSGFSRIMRHEIKGEELDKILSIIDELAAERV